MPVLNLPLLFVNLHPLLIITVIVLSPDYRWGAPGGRPSLRGRTDVALANRRRRRVLGNSPFYVRKIFRGVQTIHGWVKRIMGAFDYCGIIGEELYEFDVGPLPEGPAGYLWPTYYSRVSRECLELDSPCPQCENTLRAKSLQQGGRWIRACRAQLLPDLPHRPSSVKTKTVGPTAFHGLLYELASSSLQSFACLAGLPTVGARIAQ